MSRKRIESLEWSNAKLRIDLARVSQELGEAEHLLSQVPDQLDRAKREGAASLVGLIMMAQAIRYFRFCTWVESLGPLPERSTLSDSTLRRLFPNDDDSEEALSDNVEQP